MPTFGRHDNQIRLLGGFEDRRHDITVAAHFLPSPVFTFGQLKFRGNSPPLTCSRTISTASSPKASAARTARITASCASGSLVDRQQDAAQMNDSVNGHHAAATTGHKERHRFAATGDRLSYRWFEPKRQATLPACGKHHQVRFLLLNLSYARSHRIAPRADLGYSNSEPLENIEGSAPRLKHLPPRKSLSNGRKFGPIFSFTAASVHDDQLGFSDQRDGKGVGKRQLAGFGKVRGMKNRPDKSEPPLLLGPRCKSFQDCFDGDR